MQTAFWSTRRIRLAGLSRLLAGCSTTARRLGGSAKPGLSPTVGSSRTRASSHMPQCFRRPLTILSFNKLANNRTSLPGPRKGN